MNAAIQEAIQYEKEVLELVETLKTREAGIEMTAPHHLDAIESANEYLETRAEVISKTRPRLNGDSTDELFEKRAKGIEKTSPHETTNEAIGSADLYLESRAEGIAKTHPSLDQRQERVRPGLQAFKNTESAMA